MNLHDVEDIYELSPMQEGMLFHTLYKPSEATYLTQHVFTLRGDRAIPALTWTWRQAMARHAMLRTSFHWEGTDKPLQVVHRHALPQIEEHDWRDCSAHEQDARLERFLKVDRRRDFDLTCAPLMRLAAIRVAEEEYRFVWTYSHLLLDGWSLGLLLDEVFAHYEAFRGSSSLDWPAPRPYRDYIAWLQRQDLQAAERFWRNVLRGFSAPTSLPLPAASANASEGDWGEAIFELGNRETDALLVMAREHELTLHTVLLGAWAVVLSRYSGDRDVLFGVTSSGRPADLPGVERMIGLFINTLPVRLQLDPGAAVITWLQEVQKAYAETREREYAPLAQIQTWSDLPRGVPLFHTLLMLEANAQATAWRPSPRRDAERGSIPKRHESTEGDRRLLQRTNYPLTVCLAKAGDGLVGTFSYDPQRFDRAGVARMVGHLREVLAALARNQSPTLSRLPLLSETESQTILVDWNQTQSSFPRDRLIHELFEAQVERTPDAVAVVGLDERDRLTYGELNRQANQLAHRLRALADASRGQPFAGAGMEPLVAVALGRSSRMLVALLGILKSGAGYVPLDPKYPSDRLAFTLRDSGATVVVTEERVRHFVPAPAVATVCFDRDASALAEETDANPIPRRSSANVAYVIYTSGSTGTPKGVIIQHRSTVAFLHWVRATYTDAELAGVLATTSLCYDCSVFELFGPLSWGGCVLLADSVLHLPSMPNASDVTLISTGPAALAEILAADALPRSIRTINLGGEPSPETLLRALASDDARRIWHMYGPTEDTSYSTCALLDRSNSEYASIGRPLPDTTLYVLDRDRNPVPIGVTGELYIGGEGLARGYWGRPGQTAQTFVPDAFGSQPGGRLYRTGDLVAYRPDGSLLFKGRRDHQLKIRGSRIEPAEIEAALLAHPSVKEAAVTARDIAGEKRLVAYFAVHAGRTITRHELTQFLRERLPDAWMPAYYAPLDALPHLPNGKLDRSRLPETVSASLSEEQPAAVAPSTPLEREIAAIWRTVLRREAVGIHDNFFDLGGHSLLMLHLHCQLRETLGTDISLSELFKYPTVAALAARLTRGDERAPQAVQGRARGTLRRALVTAQPDPRQNRRGSTEIHTRGH